MTLWYVWECKCGRTMTLNYNATEAQYQRLKTCYCGDFYEWKYNVEEAEGKDGGNET